MIRTCETCKKDIVECTCIYDRRDLWIARVQNMTIHLQNLKDELENIEEEVRKRQQEMVAHYDNSDRAEG